MRELIDVTLLKTGKKYLLEPCCDGCHANVNIQQIESFSGKVFVAYCPKCGNYLKAIEQTEQADPYAEQRKWIGKLCRFWDGDGFDEVGYLTEIDPDMPEAKFRCNCHDYYEHCEPVKPDDDIIYKGE